MKKEKKRKPDSDSESDVNHSRDSSPVQVKKEKTDSAYDKYAHAGQKRSDYSDRLTETSERQERNNRRFGRDNIRMKEESNGREARYDRRAPHGSGQRVSRSPVREYERYRQQSPPRDSYRRHSSDTHRERDTHYKGAGVSRSDRRREPERDRDRKGIGRSSYSDKDSYRDRGRDHTRDKHRR